MSLVRVVRAQLHRMGLDVIRYDAERSAELQRWQLFEERGIDLVLDVGANQGQYAGAMRRKGYHGRIVSFEPLASAYRELERRASAVPGWETRHFALGDTTRKVSSRAQPTRSKGEKYSHAYHALGRSRSFDPT